MAMVFMPKLVNISANTLNLSPWLPHGGHSLLLYNPSVNQHENRAKEKSHEDIVERIKFLWVVNYNNVSST